MSKFDLARAAARHIDPYVDQDVLDAAAARFTRARSRQQTARTSAIVVMVLALGTGVAWLEPTADHDAATAHPAVVPDHDAVALSPPPRHEPPSQTPVPWLRIGDSDVMKLDDATSFEITGSGSDSVHLRLHHGALRIAGGTEVKLVAGHAAIRAQHSEFSASAHGDKLAVYVARGSIELVSPGARQRVTVGTSVTVSTAARPSDPAPAVTPQVTPPPVAEDRIEELMKVADEARRNGNMARAIAVLREAAEVNDSRRPTVLFTLGKLLLNTKQPEAAAIVFAKAAASDPHGLLIEDSLAREIEAWSLANKLDVARVRARVYFALYPHGLFRDAVSRWSKTSPP